MNKVRLMVLTLFLLALSALGACSPRQTPEPVPTLPPLTSQPTSPPTLPTPVVTKPVPPQPTPLPACVDRATLENAETVPSGTILPGQSFVQTWRLLNSGTCTWTEAYALVFVTGDRMGAADAVPLPVAVAPGSRTELSVALTAPAGKGTYEARWQLRDARGARFGIGDNGQDPLTVRVVVDTTPVATPTPTLPPPANVWRGEYYANLDLSGSPVLVRDDSAIDFDWGTSAPGPTLPADGFSVRWSRKLTFEGGPYHFRVIVDDGVRLWVDDMLVLDAWSDGASREVTADATLAAGDHSLRIEYYDHGGDAVIQVSWDKIISFPDWKGEYWANANLTGDPVLVRNDTAVDFNWGDGAPASGLPADNFSARWTRTADFDEAAYRFHVQVDDGAILYMDGQAIIDSWREGSWRELTIDRSMAAGSHDVRVEYYEKGGQATIKVWWEKASPAFFDWKGEYWSNPDLSGTPALVQNEGRIDFNWGNGSVAGGLPADNFSARWTRTIRFDAGNYRFHILVDEGARLWIDGQMAIDSWRDGTVREVTADVTLGRGDHVVRAEYYERTGEAQMHLWWERLP